MTLFSFVKNRGILVAITISVWGLWCSPLSAQSTIQWIDGSVSNATIESISPDGVVTGRGVPANTKLGKIVGYETKVPAIAPGAVEVLIAGNGKLFTNQIEIQDTTATISSPAGAATTLSLDIIETVVFTRTERVDQQIADRSDSADTVIVDTPDGEKVVAGIFEGLARGKLGLNFNGKSRKIGVEKINAFSLADLGLETRQGSQVQLTDGSTLNGKIANVNQGTLTFEITTKHSIEIPWTSVSQLEIRSDNLVYLSSLEPIVVEQKAIFAPQRTWQRDRSIESNPIRLQDPQQPSPQTYRKGIGTQSYSELRFANTNQFERFQAVAGIDAETHGHGDCQMSVFADGIALWSQRIAANKPPVNIDVDISGMAVITLVVEPGQQFDLADHADWADAKFVKP